MFGIGDGGAPVCQIVLHQRHGAVLDAFFHFGKVHFVGSGPVGKCLEHGSDVKCLVAFLHVLGDECLGHRERGIERQFGICRMAENAAAVIEDLNGCLVGRKRGVGGLVHCTVDNGRTGNGNGSCQ